MRNGEMLLSCPKPIKLSKLKNKKGLLQKISHFFGNETF